MSVVPEHAATVDEHLHTLLVASQYDPDVTPAHDVLVPHLQNPSTHFSPSTLHVIEAQRSMIVAEDAFTSSFGGSSRGRSPRRSIL